MTICPNCDECAIANADPLKPIVYEIHVTVAPAPVSDFRLACFAIGVKPVLLELQRDQKDSLTDMMTSSVVNDPDFEIALAIAKGIEGDLRAFGFKPIRVKIETVPWHPAARSLSNDNQYFESHFAIVFPTDQGAVDSLVSNFNLHLSRNVFKKNVDQSYIQMVTYRTRGLVDDFLAVCDDIVSFMNDHGIKHEKVIKEFAIFDTKVDHDNAWTNSES